MKRATCIIAVLPVLLTSIALGADQLPARFTETMDFERRVKVEDEAHRQRLMAINRAYLDAMDKKIVALTKDGNLDLAIKARDERDAARGRYNVLLGAKAPALAVDSRNPNFVKVAEVSKGQKLELTAKGSFLIKTGRDSIKATANGVPYDGKYPLGCLIARIGDREYKVGSSAVIYAEADGDLEVRIWDTMYEDNQGTLNLEISISGENLMPADVQETKKAE